VRRRQLGEPAVERHELVATSHRDQRALLVLERQRRHRGARQLRNSLDGDRRNQSIAITERSMAITENGPSRSVVRPVPSRSRADPGVIRGCPQA
jgi:hypothetical protein